MMETMIPMIDFRSCFMWTSKLRRRFTIDVIDFETSSLWPEPGYCDSNNVEAVSRMEIVGAEPSH
jgi:hypothetical protein